MPAALKSQSAKNESFMSSELYFFELFFDWKSTAASALSRLPCELIRFSSSSTGFSANMLAECLALFAPLQIIMAESTRYLRPLRAVGASK